jgi:hypothetical protein
MRKSELFLPKNTLILEEKIPSCTNVLQRYGFSRKIKKWSKVAESARNLIKKLPNRQVVFL